MGVNDHIHKGLQSPNFLLIFVCYTNTHTHTPELPVLSSVNSSEHSLQAYNFHRIVLFNE